MSTNVCLFEVVCENQYRRKIILCLMSYNAYLKNAKIKCHRYVFKFHKPKKFNTHKNMFTLVHNIHGLSICNVFLELVHSCTDCEQM